jgi:hypothetical protein
MMLGAQKKTVVGEGCGPTIHFAAPIELTVYIRLQTNRHQR